MADQRVLTDESLPPAKPQRRRWRHILFAVVACITAASLLLVGAGRYLVVDQAELRDASNVLIVDASAASLSADALRSNADCRLLIIRKFPERPMQLGVLPPFDKFLRERLIEKGVPEENIEIIAGTAFDPRSHARFLKEWLDRNPSANVVVICDRLSSRSWRRAFDQVLGKDASRVEICAVARRNINEWNWWTTKLGMIQVIRAYLELMYSH